MKFDKDTLLKQRFWVMLGFAAPLAVIAIFILLIIVGAEIRGYREKIEAQLKKVNQLKEDEYRNDKLIEEIEKDRKKIQAQENLLWEQGYKSQEPLFTWPKSMEEKFQFREGWFAKEVKAERGKDGGAKEGGAKEGDGKEAKGATQAPSGKEPAAPKGEIRELKGVIKDVGEGYFSIIGPDKKEYLIRETVKLKVDIVGAKEKQYLKDLRAGDRVTVRVDRGKYFNDPLTIAEQAEYQKLNVYLSQIEAIYAQVQPINEKGDGVVQLRGWVARSGELPPASSKFLRYLAGGFQLKDHDLSEEAWLLQQDIWINSEIYRLIRQANDYVSRFDLVRDFAGQGGKGKDKTFTFQNNYLAVDAKWTSEQKPDKADKVDKLDLTFKNQLKNPQRLYGNFLVRTGEKGQPEKISLGGQKLAAAGAEGSEWKTTVTLDKNVPRSGVFGLTQVLPWEERPVAEDEARDKTFTFRNPYWEIDVTWNGESDLKLKLKNQLNRRQKLDIQFLIHTQKDQEAEKFSVGGEPLNPKGADGAEREVTVKLEGALQRTGIYKLEQVLTWETAAVKRIDGVFFGSAGTADGSTHSHRTVPMGTRPYKKEDKKEDGEKKDDQPKGKFGFGAGGGKGGPGNLLLTPNGLARDCYIDVTNQARRLPAVVTLIVDQDHIDRVQSSFANSKLRFLTTQVLLNRYPGSMRPQLFEVAVAGKAAAGKDKGFKPAPGQPAPGLPNFLPGGAKGGIRGLPGGGGAGRPGFNPGVTGRPAIGGGGGTPGGRPQPTATTSDEMEANVEMTIYGIVTLYQRYPPPTK